MTNDAVEAKSFLLSDLQPGEEVSPEKPFGRDTNTIRKVRQMLDELDTEDHLEILGLIKKETAEVQDHETLKFEMEFTAIAFNYLREATHRHANTSDVNPKLVEEKLIAALKRTIRRISFDPKLFDVSQK